MCFFFQAEDGIRDIGVTGVQTCALPIYAGPACCNRDTARSPGTHLVPRRHLTRGRETKKAPASRAFGSAPERIRTSDLRFRRPTLYPAELRALTGGGQV